MTRRSPLKRKARKKQPGDDPKYLAWIRTLPCELWPTLSTTCSGRVEAHHAGDHGFAQKAPDRSAIPLCGYHHRLARNSVHVLGKAFWTYHGLDRDAIIKQLNTGYDRKGTLNVQCAPKQPKLDLDGPKATDEQRKATAAESD